MKEPKVLVGVVTYEGKDYIFDECYKAITSFDYKNYDYIIFDNSKTQNYVNKKRRQGMKNIFHAGRSYNAMVSIANCQELIRKKAMREDYDYVLMVESDLVPPPDTIKRLMSHGKDIIGSTYLLDYSGTKLPCIFKHLDTEHGRMQGHRMLGILPKENGENEYLPEEVKEYSQHIKNGDVLRVAGCGFGCTLFHKFTFNKFMFKPMRASNSTRVKPSDSYVYYTLNGLGIPIFVDAGFVVPHYPSKWDLVKDRELKQV